MLDSVFALPEQFFAARRDRMNGFRAAGIALAAAILMTGLAGVFLRALASEMTATTEIDNPDRPSEQTCEVFGDTAAGAPSGCEKPAKLTVEMGELFWEQAAGQLFLLFLGIMLLWVLVGAGLHLLSGGFSGEGSFGQTLEVVSWSLVFEVLATAISVGLLWLAVQQVDLAVSDPELLLSRLKQMAGTTPALGAKGVQIVAVLAQIGVWIVGLSVVHRVERGTAAIGSVLVGAIMLVLILV